jgi:hypothetical protein
MAPHPELFFPHYKRGKATSTEFNKLLPDLSAGKVQVQIIGTRKQVQHTINKFYLKQITNDRVKVTPIVPTPFATGKYMTVLLH